MFGGRALYRLSSICGASLRTAERDATGATTGAKAGVETAAKESISGDEVKGQRQSEAAAPRNIDLWLTWHIKSRQQQQKYF